MPTAEPAACTQLESQRQYFETLLARHRAEADAEVESACAAAAVAREAAAAAEAAATEAERRRRQVESKLVRGAGGLPRKDRGWGGAVGEGAVVRAAGCC